MSKKITQCLFILLLILNIFWVYFFITIKKKKLLHFFFKEFQLIITLLYYHTFSHKLIGSMFGICCWLITYRIWFKKTFPFAPICQKLKKF